eukprot:9111716-Lingulodinium_polyedra.AAC.1
MTVGLWEATATLFLLGKLSSALPLPTAGPNGAGDAGDGTCHRFSRGGRGALGLGGGGTDAATGCAWARPTLGL